MSIQPIVTDHGFLTGKSGNYIPGRDEYIIRDLLDTANAHKERCAGLAAPQIGHHIRAVVARMGNEFVPFINPVIIKHSPGWYYIEEGCLSLEGKRSVKRYHTIMVNYTDAKGNRRTRQFSGPIAQILQHEIDHLNGVLI